MYCLRFYRVAHITKNLMCLKLGVSYTITSLYYIQQYFLYEFFSYSLLASAHMCPSAEPIFSRFLYINSVLNSTV